MAIPAGHWVIDIEKLLGGEYWTNRYIVAAASLADATDHGQSLTNRERGFHHSSVLFTRFRASDGIKLSDVYQVVNINAFGDQGATAATLPLFNVMRVDFNVVGGGRPSRKYYRLPISEDMQDNGNFTANHLANMQPHITGILTGVPEYRDVDGQVFINGTIYPKVGMRQLRRGSKRKTAATGIAV
jgi:hypothetical protein